MFPAVTCKMMQGGTGGCILAPNGDGSPKGRSSGHCLTEREWNRGIGSQRYSAISDGKEHSPKSGLDYKDFSSQIGDPLIQQKSSPVSSQVWGCTCNSIQIFLHGWKHVPKPTVVPKTCTLHLEVVLWVCHVLATDRIQKSDWDFLST